MTKRKETNAFADIIAARQQPATPEERAGESTPPPAAPAPEPAPAPTTKAGRNAKRGHPDYSAVTVYLRTENYTRAQFEMARRGRKREMSELIDELLAEWLTKQS